MSESNFTFSILRQLNDDWVSYAESWALFHEAFGSTHNAKEHYWQLLENLLRKNLLCVGELDAKEQFVSWSLLPADAIGRIQLLAVNIPTPFPGDVCWFDITSEGKKTFTALSLERAARN